MMRLSKETISKFMEVSKSVIHTSDDNKVKSPEYEEVLKQVKDEVGEYFSWDDATMLCALGFFVSNNNFCSMESMHAYKGCLYYEDGANLTISGFVNRVPEFLKEGWYIKATPDFIDFNKLSEMHDEYGSLMLSDISYEECFISNKRENKSYYEEEESK